jgi:hypothetical protein
LKQRCLRLKLKNKHALEEVFPYTALDCAIYMQSYVTRVLEEGWKEETGVADPGNEEAESEDYADDSDY